MTDNPVVRDNFIFCLGELHDAKSFGKAHNW